MTITIQTEDEKVEEVKCDKIEVFTDCFVYYTGDEPKGNVKLENVVRVTQE